MNAVKLIRRMCRVGENIRLAVYGDSVNALGAACLRYDDTLPDGDNREDAALYILGGHYAGMTEIHEPEGADILFALRHVEIRSFEHLRFADWYGRAWSVTDVGAAASVLMAPDVSCFNEEFIGRLIIRPLLDRMFQARGMLVLHGAGVSYEHSGCMILGASGSGKSTLCAGLLDRGFHYLADDRVLMEGSGCPAPVMHAYPENIRMPKSHRGPKHTIVPPESPERTVPVTTILFLDKTAATDAIDIVPVGKAEASARMTGFLPPFTEKDIVGGCFSSIGDLCEHIPAYCLRGWGTASERAKAVADLLTVHGSPA